MGATDGVYVLTCPDCGASAKIGLPRNAGIETVTTAPDGECGDGGPSGVVQHKRRATACDNGHRLHVCFAVRNRGAGRPGGDDSR